MRYLLILPVILLAACATTTVTPTGKGLNVNGLDEECPMQLPELTQEINSSEYRFLDWIGAVFAQYDACRESKHKLVQVLKSNEVLK